MEKTTTMFIVTTMCKMEKEERFERYEFGSVRSVGIYPTFEAAEYVVKNNVNDLCETIYNYALIEEIGFGMYPYLESQHLYKVVNITTKGTDGKMYYNPNLTYEEIEIPHDFKKMYSMVIG